jgi:type I restriction-modification system DNA methylase subunit
MTKKKKIEFGDFQTPIELTDNISKFIKTIFPAPNIIIEPTCGLGSFVKSCKSIWGTNCSYYGFDVNPQYIEKCNTNIRKTGRICFFLTKNLKF